MNVFSQEPMTRNLYLYEFLELTIPRIETTYVVRQFNCPCSSLTGFLNCGLTRGPLRPVLKINLLGKGLTPRLSMRLEALGYAGVLTIYANHPDGNFRHKYEMI